MRCHSTVIPIACSRFKVHVAIYEVRRMEGGKPCVNISAQELDDGSLEKRKAGKPS
jgi:hypothetical protein